MTASTVLAHVRKRGPVTCAAVAAAFGVTCAEAGAALRALRADGKVRSQGRTKGTRYTAR